MADSIGTVQTGGDYSSSYGQTMDTTHTGTGGIYNQHPMYASNPESPSQYVPSSDEFQFISTSEVKGAGEFCQSCHVKHCLSNVEQFYNYR